MPFSSQPRHFLSIAPFQRLELETLLERAQKNIPLAYQHNKRNNRLAGRTQINLFFENSTRTLASFEIAGKRLGLDVINFPVGQSSLKKGETLLDTAYTLEAMHPDILVIRHWAAGAAQYFSERLQCSIINAGDGRHEHPTQALLDALTILQHKKTLSGLKIAICGDSLHSRVARSNIACLSKLGSHVCLVGPSTLLPSDAKNMGVEVFTTLKEGLEDADVIMLLRLQKERMEGGLLSSLAEYHHFYGLTQKTLRYAKPNCLIMHPGPINRGVEISSDIADGSQSVIRQQVEMGVALRMAVIETLLSPCNNQS